MRLTISGSLKADHEELRWLVAEGFRGTNDAGVEIHLKAHVERRWYVVTWSDPRAEGKIIRQACRTKQEVARRLLTDPDAVVEWHRTTPMFKGLAYSSIPRVARVARGSRFLVTLAIPGDPTRKLYPYRWHYSRYKRALPIDLASWQEHLVHLTAHEARHTWQFRNKRKGSEIDAERHAHKILDQLRELYADDPRFAPPGYEVDESELVYVRPVRMLTLEEQDAIRGFGIRHGCGPITGRRQAV